MGATTMGANCMGATVMGATIVGATSMGATIMDANSGQHTFFVTCTELSSCGSHLQYKRISNTHPATCSRGSSTQCFMTKSVHDSQPQAAEAAA